MNKLLKAIKNKNMNYADGFCAGWNLERCGYPTSFVEDLKKDKLANKENIEGVLDGWLARRERTNEK